MANDERTIRRNLNGSGWHEGTDAQGREWYFVIDEEGEVYGYRESRRFGASAKEAAPAIAAFLAALEAS